MLKEVQLNTYYNIDCKELLAALPDKFIDLAIIDPPYGIGENGDKNHTRGKRAFGGKALSIAQDYPAFAGGGCKRTGRGLLLRVIQSFKESSYIWC